MSDEPDNLVLVYLRRISTDVGEIKQELREVKERLSSLEQGQGFILRQLGALTETDARVQASMDRMRVDIDRINRRLDIADAATPGL